MSVQYTSTVRIPSQRYPGATIVIRKVTEKRLRKLRLLIADPAEKEREIYKQYAELAERQTIKRKEDGSEEIDPETCVPVKEFTDEQDVRKAVELFQQIDDFRVSELYPIYLRWGLTKIEDFEIDGHEPSIEDLLSDDAPDGLLAEVIQAIMDSGEVPAEKKTEQLSHSTS